MPITLISNIVPANGNTFYILEDSFLKGGYQTVSNIEARDAIDPVNLKAGMAVFTQEPKNLWILNSDLTTWTKFSSGGGARVVSTLEERDALTDLDPGSLAYIQDDLTLWVLLNDLTTWVEISSNSSAVSGRFISTFTNPLPLLNGEKWDFTIPIGSDTAILLRLSAKDPCVIEVHSTPLYVDTNPLRFIASADHLSDDGSTIMSDGSAVYGRRYSIVSNMEQPLFKKKVYGRLINTQVSSLKTTITLEILPQ